MFKQTRRNFLKTAGLASMAVTGPSINVLGANNTIRAAVCGVHSQGSSNAKQLQNVDGVEVVAFCDPDQAVLDEKIKSFEDNFPGTKLEGIIDYRRLLDRKDIDVVCVATPNHWHSLMGIEGCQAGKDMYVQKPLCHTMWEGGQLVKAAAKYDRIVQTGTQNRSDVGLREYFPDLFAGKYGKIKMIRGLCYKNRDSIGKLDSPLKIPDSVDYNLWLGPGEDVPIYRTRLHYEWHWDWNCGNGDIGNQGPHEFDMIRWAMGDKSMPSSVVCFGGRFGWNDAGITPNMQIAAFEWDGVPVYFEVRDMKLSPTQDAQANFLGTRVGFVVTCEDGYFVGGRGGGWVYDNDGNKVKHYSGDSGGGHFQNFIDAVRSRKTSDLRAPAINGYKSACLAHMANTSYRLGKEMSEGDLHDCMSGDDVALEAIDRYTEHLAAWNVDLKKTPWTVGPSLGFDGKTMKYTGKGPQVEKANAMRRRNYREPFVVPKKV